MVYGPWSWPFSKIDFLTPIFPPNWLSPNRFFKFCFPIPFLPDHLWPKLTVGQKEPLAKKNRCPKRISTGRDFGGKSDLRKTVSLVRENIFFVCKNIFFQPEFWPTMNFWPTMRFCYEFWPTVHFDQPLSLANR